ncbi:MAG: ClpXP protease specificity-enhancing factor SspB [Pseudomonadota bacterium]
MTDEVQTPESLLPYDRWTEEALREVVVRALEHVAAHGLPGEHHFYMTFRTDAPGVEMPGHLRARYPQEMTIVLQHRFWDLVVDRVAQRFSVGLSFGGVASALSIPLSALTAFADPQIRYGLRFQPAVEAPTPAPEIPEFPDVAEASPPAQVVSLDAFRRRPAKEG